MKKITLVLFTCTLLLTALAQDKSATRKTTFNYANNVAIKGYDPVAYFTQNAAVKGKKEIAISHMGIIYYFATVANKELFKLNPNKYEPQYGGWCAYAMGNDGTKVEIDPETFKIVDSKLYLFYNRYFTNTLKSWNKNESKLKLTADTNWLKIYK